MSGSIWTSSFVLYIYHVRFVCCIVIKPIHILLWGQNELSAGKSMGFGANAKLGMHLGLVMNGLLARYHHML